MTDATRAMLLAPFGAIYAALTHARLKLYQSGMLTVHHLPVPVISVGNLTTGGTGKTPVVEWIARRVAREDFRPGILTRGYGRVEPDKRVIVSDGERILAGAIKGGDEPLLLAEALRGMAAVVSDKDRVAAAHWALENLNSNVFILDDGFQHLRLARDLNIALIDATDPWGGGKLLPRGRLRESPKGLSRADCIIITRADQVESIESLRHEIALFNHQAPIVLAHTRISEMLPLSDELPAEQINPSQPVAAFCAIGNPNAFFKQVRDAGYDLSYTRSFPDHHVYTQEDVDDLCRRAREHGARLLFTTRKDSVKLRSHTFALPCYVVGIEMEFDDEGKLTEMIRGALRKESHNIHQFGATQ